MNGKPDAIFLGIRALISCVGGPLGLCIKADSGLGAKLISWAGWKTYLICKYGAVAVPFIIILIVDIVFNVYQYKTHKILKVQCRKNIVDSLVSSVVSYFLSAILVIFGVAAIECACAGFMAYIAAEFLIDHLTAWGFGLQSRDTLKAAITYIFAKLEAFCKYIIPKLKEKYDQLKDNYHQFRKNNQELVSWLDACD